MDVSALKIVLMVAQQGSIAGAARGLDLDASSVSRIVAAVERELGLRLFQRSTRRLSVTEEGEIYLRRLAPLLDELEAARDAAAAARLSPRGVLRLTASVAFAQERVAPLLPAFQQAYPDITVELLATDANLDLLAEGVDLAIRLAASPAGDVVATRLVPTRYRVVAAPAYARERRLQHPEDLAAANCLRFALPQYRSRWRFRQAGAAPFAVDVSGKTVISNALALREAARAGMGPALMADWLIDGDVERGALVDLFPGFDCAAAEFDTAAWALYPSKAYLPQKVRVAVDFLRRRLPRPRLADQS